jgi:hypothetical protein
MQKYLVRTKWTMWVSASATLILVIFVAAGVQRCVVTSSKTSPGVVTGIAAMCSGPFGLPPYNVEARLLQGKRVVAHQTYIGNRFFRFSVAPGNHVVNSDQSYAVPVHVTVRSGQAVHADVNSACS